MKRKMIPFIIGSILFSILICYSQETTTETSKETEKKEATITEKISTESSQPAPSSVQEESKPTQTKKVESTSPRSPAISEENKLLNMIETDPKNVEAYNRLLRIYAQQEKHKERLKIALKAIQNIGRTVTWCLIVGDESRILGDNQNALTSYQFALAIQPTNPEIYNRIGLSLLKLSRPNQAEAAFKAAVFFSSSEPSTSKSVFYNNLGVAYEALEDLQSAYRNFQLAARYNPAYSTAQANVKRVKELLLSSGQKIE